MQEKYSLSTKKKMLEHVKEKLAESPNFVITNYKGLTVADVEKLRKDLSSSSSNYFVVKNSILKRAFDELDLKDANSFIKGAVGLGLLGDVMAAFKTLANFTKEKPELRLCCAVIDGKLET